MTLLLVKSGSAVLFVGYDLVRLVVSDDLGLHRRARDDGGAYRGRIANGSHQHRAELHRRTDIGCEEFHRDLLALTNSVLLTTGLNDGVRLISGFGLL